MVQKHNLLAAFLWLVSMFITSSLVLASEQLSVDCDTVIQQNFLGINAVYHAFTYMPESVEQGMDDNLRDIEFRRVKTAGLHIARTFYRPDWAMGEEAWAEPDWDSVKMRAFYQWLTEMQRLHVDVALNMGWWFGRDVIWNRDQHLPSYPDDMQHYATWVSESLHQIIQVRGFSNVKYIIMFTEPAARYGDIPVGKTTWDYYKEVLRVVHTRLVAAGLRDRVKIVGPNSTWGSGWVEKAVVELDPVVDIYTSHSYNSETYQQWLDLAVKIREATEGSGKPFWVDEYGVQDHKLRQDPSYGLALARANAAFLNAGAQASMLWLFNDQYYPYPLKYISNGDSFVDGLHKWGLFPWLPESRSVRPAWYVFSLLSRLMGGGNGTVIYKTVGRADLHIAATGQSGKISIMLVNDADYSRDFTLRIQGWGATKPLYHYLYDPVQVALASSCDVLKCDHRVNLSGGRLRDVLPAKSMAVYSSTELSAVPREKTLLSWAGNVAWGRAVSATSSTIGHPAANLTDGRRLFYWSSEEKSVDSPESITIDLGNSYQLDHVALYPRTGRRHLVGVGFPVSYVLELSDDGKLWHTIFVGHAVKRPRAAVMIRFRSSSQARYIRLTGEKQRRTDLGRYAMQIAEIKVYAKEYAQ